MTCDASARIAECFDGRVERVHDSHETRVEACMNTFLRGREVGKFREELDECASRQIGKLSGRVVELVPADLAEILVEAGRWRQPKRQKEPRYLCTYLRTQAFERAMPVMGLSYVHVRPAQDQCPCTGTLNGACLWRTWRNSLRQSLIRHSVRLLRIPQRHDDTSP